MFLFCLLNYTSLSIIASLNLWRFGFFETYVLIKSNKKGRNEGCSTFQFFIFSTKFVYKIYNRITFYLSFCMKRNKVKSFDLFIVLTLLRMSVSLFVGFLLCIETDWQVATQPNGTQFVKLVWLFWSSENSTS